MFSQSPRDQISKQSALEIAAEVGVFFTSSIPASVSLRSSRSWRYRAALWAKEESVSARCVIYVEPPFQAGRQVPFPSHLGQSIRRHLEGSNALLWHNQQDLAVHFVRHNYTDDKNYKSLRILPLTVIQ